MADKYAHLRPAKSRSCFTATGRPKIRYTQSEANAQVSYIMSRRRFEGEPEVEYHAYQCPVCLWWHCGAKRQGPSDD